MKRFLLPLVALLAAGASIQAAEPSDPAPKQILDRYVEATGGRAALEKLKSRAMKGKIELTTFGVSGPFEIQSKAPNRQTSKLEIEGFGEIREGYDGTVAWALAPGAGLREKSGAELDRVRRSTVFPRELNIEQSYRSLATKGSAKVNDVDAWLIEATPKEGKPDRLYFDKKSGLLVREESTVDTAVGEMTFQIDVSDYRDVDGVKVPFSMKVPKPAEMGFQIRFEEVKHNVEIGDAAFAKPKG